MLASVSGKTILFFRKKKKILKIYKQQYLQTLSNFFLKKKQRKKLYSKIDLLF